MAANMAVVAGVHVSCQEYSDALKRLKQARKIDGIDREIQKLTNQAADIQVASGVTKIRSEVRGLRSSVASVLAYADAQSAYGRFLFSLGMSPVDEGYQTLSDKELANKIEKRMANWNKGDLPKPAKPTEIPKFISQR
jgi:hypothetical protein